MRAMLLFLLLWLPVGAADYPREMANNQRWAQEILDYALTRPQAQRRALEQLVCDARAMGTLDPHKTYDALEATVSHLERVSSPIPNYGEVVPGRLVRGAQPSPEGLRWLREQGVKTLIVLREPGVEETNYPGWTRAQYLQAAREQGMQVVELPIRDTTLPTPAQIDRFFTLVDRTATPCFVHCSAGIGRTGILAGLYLRHRGATPAQALEHAKYFMLAPDAKPDHALQAAFLANYPLGSVPGRSVPAAVASADRSDPLGAALADHQPLALVEATALVVDGALVTRAPRAGEAARELHPQRLLVQALADGSLVRFHFTPESLDVLGSLSRAFPPSRKMGRVALADLEPARRWLGEEAPLEVVCPLPPDEAAAEALGRRLQGRARLVDLGQTPPLAVARVLERYGVAVEVHDDPGWSGLEYLRVGP